MPHVKALSILTSLVALGLIGSCQHHRATTAQAPPPAAIKPAPQQADTESTLTARRGPLVQTYSTEPDLRIRIGRAQTEAMFGLGGSVRVGPGYGDLGKARPYTFQAPLRVAHDKQGFVLTEPNGKRIRWRLSTLEIISNVGRLTVGEHPYPGKLELVARTDKAGRPTGEFDLVNHVGMESYLPGVLSKELYPNWDPEAYRAQAIAARSYAIWEKNLPIRVNSHFDLEASQASQAYIGDKASEKARAAVADTTGQVLVFERRVLPAFYSSCSGGLGQDAVAAWPEKVDDLAPLRGRAHGGWGQQSSKFRWGPVTRDRDTLSKRIAAWGKVNQHACASLGRLSRVEVIANNGVGRPTRFRVTDVNGQTINMNVEDLRMATNFPANGLPAVDSSNMIYSSHAVYTVADNAVNITGQGFGHGVGLCQFGTQHMASTGNRHEKILAFYYPGATIRKAY
ncbi:MAG: SpoIID/LytB domain-containing protein [Phycisphaeraceae bacterium]